jgi:mitochondrial import receptor subunit TOM40
MRLHACPYQPCKRFPAQFASPLLIGDIDASGNLTARVIHWVRPNVLAKLTYQGQVGSRDQDVAMAEFDFRGADYTAAVKVQNPDIVNEGGTWIAQYMQSITKKLALGGELIYQYQMGLQQCDLNFAGRYKSDKGVATATLSPLAAAFALSYAHKVNEKVCVCARSMQ